MFCKRTSRNIIISYVNESDAVTSPCCLISDGETPQSFPVKCLKSASMLGKEENDQVVGNNCLVFMP